MQVPCVGQDREGDILVQNIAQGSGNGMDIDLGDHRLWQVFSRVWTLQCTCLTVPASAASFSNKSEDGVATRARTCEFVPIPQMVEGLRGKLWKSNSDSGSRKTYLLYVFDLGNALYEC